MTVPQLFQQAIGQPPGRKTVSLAKPLIADQATAA
jgi:hypothetical protein